MNSYSLLVHHLGPGRTLDMLLRARLLSADDAHTAGFVGEGQPVVVLGATRDELDGGEWAHALHGHLGGVPPQVDLAAEKALADFFVAAVRAGVVTSSHDVSDGGLAVALAESVLRQGVGASIDLAPVCDRDGVDPVTALLSESVARAVVTVADEAALATLVSLAAAHGVPVARVGVTGGSTLKVKDVLELDVEALREAHTGTMRRYFAS